MDYAYINPKILSWARERCGFDRATIAEKLKVEPTDIEAWETDKEKPSIPKAKEFARRTHIPFGYLYLKTPPEIKMPIADFRSGWRRTSSEEELHLQALVKSILHKKDWFEDYLVRKGTNIRSDDFQSKFNVRHTSTVIAEDIRRYLELEIEEGSNGRGKPAAFWQKFKTNVQQKNIWLIQTSVFENNNKRAIPPNVALGLALKSPYFPIIWVNSKLQPAPKNFTLAHELAHIWIGAEGISNFGDDAEQKTDNRLEQLCDEVASEILVPEKILRSKWDSQLSAENNVEQLYEFFGVSRFVVARKAVHSSYIPKTEYAILHKTLHQRAHTFNGNEVKNRDGGANFYDVVIARNGRAFAEAVIEEAENRNLLLKEACQLLGLSNPATLEGLSNHLRGNA